MITRYILVALLILLPAQAMAKKSIVEMTDAELKYLMKVRSTELESLRKEQARRGGAVRRKTASTSEAPNERSQDAKIATDPYGNPERGLNSSLAQSNASKIQDLYIRSDPLDAFRYLFPLSPLDGKGASISFTSNELTRTQTLATNAFISYVVAREYIGKDFGYALAPFAYFNGTLTNPERPSSERNAAQIGADIQIKFGDILPDFVQTLGLRPYYQTDFRGQASIYGFSTTYEPTKASINLGARAITPGEENIITGYFRIIPEFNYFTVDDPGRTAFIPNRNHSYLGGTLQIRTILFENMGPSWLASRFYLNGSVTYFWDALNHWRHFHDSEVEGGYIIAKDKPIEGLGRLTTSVSLIYNNGVSRLTNERRDQYKAQLNILY
ncbi:hypothetical protein [Methylobacterium sp. B4]|uniref:hypothetical protein n=1 Tax=Methylobacterium sp. B4 TaxID=1938755 RepID=UPI000D81C0E8|nr:hypothetical protein [Methylobacterium sp. B4]PXW57725.1 hypothetical protein BY998_1132 [Methylobacterium sp. B4]